jgi:3-oxoacyl-[acyl-carrier protein] reductase
VNGERGVSNTIDAPLNGRAGVVTGASSGIGHATCLALAAAGANVVGVGRDVTRLMALAENVRSAAAGRAAPGEFLPFTLDVANEAHMAHMAQQAVGAFGGLDFLVTAAGTLRGADGWPRLVGNMTLEEWREVIRTNLTGVFLSNRAVLPSMLRRGRGDIINISSTSGLKGLAFDAAYCASKFGVIGLSQALAEEVGEYGVRVHVLLPGAVDTPMWRDGDAIPHLGPALPVERVSDLICYLVQLPDDVEIAELVLTPSVTSDPPGLQSEAHPRGSVP